MNISSHAFALLALGACAGGDPAPSPSGDPGGKADTPDEDDGPSFTLPPANAAVDYQLGGAYSPASGVQIVSRDRTAPAAPGLYNICYVNGFQIQPGEEAFWEMQHPTLILRDSGGDPVIDADWNEMLVDVSTAAKRSAVAGIVADWIDGCATAGYDAIEIDNLDSFSRSGGRLTSAARYRRGPGGARCVSARIEARITESSP